jgi:C4-dicarboxylate-specific signal transduction histidine kinase
MRNLVRQEGAETELDADLNESVRRAVSLVGSQIKSHNIRLDLSLTSGLPRVRANPVQLEQVVINLSINSMQAHDETKNKNKWIQISTVMENGQAALTVRDNGPGLDGNCEEIFKPFFTTKKRADASGMGLGLSLVDTFIRSWGGRIDAAPRPGGGSEFIVLLNSMQTG